MAQLREIHRTNETKLVTLGKMSVVTIHEIRNALTTILLGLNAMQSIDLNDIDRQKLNLSLSEAERVQRLMHQLLRYAKPPQPSSSYLELNRFLAGVIETQQRVYAHAIKAIHLISSPTPIQIVVEADSLKQILINILANACEASSNNDIVTCHIQTSSADGSIEIEIHNWGESISANLLSQITQPFVTTKVDGNGIGLFVVQQLIQEQGGTLQIQSSAEQGTTVTIQLPQRRA